MIWVEHSNEDDAYIIFETLNSRGKDLEVVDLLKNLLFNKLRSQGNRQADPIRDKWNGMRRVIEGTSAGSLDVNRFILHWWLSQEPYIAERKLFRAIKGKIRSRPLARASLDSLCSDVVHYRAALDPASTQWHSSESEARRSLDALAEFRIRQPAPLLLSLMRARFGTEPRLKIGPLTATLQTIERYHFQFTMVSQLSSSGGVSEMYAKAARELCTAATTEQRAEALCDIRQKLVSRSPNREQFVGDFVHRFLLTNTQTRDGRLVRHVLRTILRLLHPDTNQEDLTIEHIMPQAKIGTDGITEQIVGSIGNLILLPESVNTKLDNKPFPAKQQILSTDGVPYDLGSVLDCAAWGPSEIDERARLLGELAYDVVWKLPL